MHPKPQVKPSPQRSPRSVGDVDATALEMDRVHGTSFRAWVKSPANLSYICTYKRSLFDHYAEQDPKACAAVLQWLTEDWTVPTVAEFLLKLFYTHRIDSARFRTATLGLVQNWDTSRRCELAGVLLVGEAAAAAARFLHHIADGSRAQLALLARSAASALRWNYSFMMEFVMELAEVVLPDLSWRDHVMRYALRNLRAPVLPRRRGGAITSSTAWSEELLRGDDGDLAIDALVGDHRPGRPWVPPRRSWTAPRCDCGPGAEDDEPPCGGLSCNRRIDAFVRTIDEVFRCNDAGGEDHRCEDSSEACHRRRWDSKLELYDLEEDSQSCKADDETK